MLSGFVSVEELVNTFFSGILKWYRKPILDLEKSANPRFFEYHALETLSKSNAKTLLIYSADDQMCKKAHFDILKSGLAGKNNIQFLLVDRKGHNPNYTEEAVKYLGEFGKSRAKLLKKKDLTDEEKAVFVASYDWDKMTEQDESVWKAIFDCLDQ